MKPHELASVVEELITLSRLNDVRLLTQQGSADRLARILAVLSALKPGAYLIGAGPYTVGVYSLQSEETVIGRLASPLEQSAGEVIDVCVNDALALTPREVSRVHLRIRRIDRDGAPVYVAVDLNSRLGSYVNGERLTPPPDRSASAETEFQRELRCGDVISLGPSLVNTFVFVEIEGGDETRE